MNAMKHSAMPPQDQHAPKTGPAPDPVDRELAPLLQEPLASAWAAADEGAAARLRARLAGRVAEAQAAAAPMHTVRQRQLAAVELAPGVRARTLYAAAPGLALRAGEPLRAQLVELEPGAAWAGPSPEHPREWLVLRGDVRLGRLSLGPRDYHAVPAGWHTTAIATLDGALVFVRESATPALADEGPHTVYDARAGWPDYAPGIRRRVLWQRDGQAALLYHAEPGASVPLHTHGHDEECLMVQGELVLDDVLLQEFDYQLAPAGTGHRITETDTGVVIYAHGDLDLRFV